MKKFDALISNYLYTNKKMELEGLVTFWLDDHFVLPPDAEKTAFFPLEGIHFTYDTKAETTPALIDYLMQQTGKIKSLIRADFSSYLAEIKQFVNIGKPWVIEGIGTLQKNKEGKFELVPGEAMSERVSMQYIDDTEDDEEPVKRRKWIVGLLFTVAVAAVVAGLGFGVYVLFIKTQKDTGREQAAYTGTDTSTIFNADSLSRKPDSMAINPVDTTNNYKAIFEITKWRERLNKRTSQLAEYGMKVYYDSTIIRDTLRYRMFIYQRIVPPSDTNRVKDSLSLYFGRRVRLEQAR